MVLHFLHDAIGLKDSRHLFIQSEVKPKPIVTRSHAFSRALRQPHVITSSFDWFNVLSVSYVIGQSNYFGFGFTTLKRKPLYNEQTRKPQAKVSPFGMAEYALASPSFTSFLNKLDRENEVRGPTCTSDLIFNVFTGSEAAIVQKDALTCMEFYENVLSNKLFDHSLKLFYSVVLLRSVPSLRVTTVHH